MSACIPDSVKDRIDDGVSKAGLMMADMQFKNAIANIELHRLRNGSYPNSLSDLKFLTAMDSSMDHSVEYTRLDTVYELNLKMTFQSLQSNDTKKIDLHYPPAFWKGLGCVKSNVK